jgi:hypothetical protein
MVATTLVALMAENVPPGTIAVDTRKRWQGIMVIGPDHLDRGNVTTEEMLRGAFALRWVLYPAELSGPSDRRTVKHTPSIAPVFKVLLDCPHEDCNNRMVRWSDWAISHSRRADTGKQARTFSPHNRMVCAHCADQGRTAGKEPIHLKQYRVRPTMFAPTGDNVTLIDIPGQPTEKIVHVSDPRREHIYLDPLFAGEEDERLHGLIGAWHDDGVITPDDSLLPRLWAVYPIGAKHLDAGMPRVESDDPECKDRETWVPSDELARGIEERMNAGRTRSRKGKHRTIRPFSHYQAIKRAEQGDRTISDPQLAAVVMDARNQMSVGWVPTDHLFLDKRRDGFTRYFLRARDDDGV